MTNNRRYTQTLANLDRDQLDQIAGLLESAAVMVDKSRRLGSAAPADPTWRQAGRELDLALARAERLRKDVEAAIRLSTLGALPPGQRPTEWVGPTPAELFDLTTSWDQMYPMKWWQFEHIVAETFRRLGFEDVHVVEGGQAGDGGIDIRMRHQESPCIVQVKHRAADEFVLIDQLRALANAAKKEQATAYLVTSGQVGVTARREMAEAVPRVFVVDGELLWK